MFYLKKAYSPEIILTRIQARRTPDITAATVALKSISRLLVVNVPVHAPLHVTGIVL